MLKKKSEEGKVILKDRFLNSQRKMPRGTQVKRDGLAITVERRGTSSRIALWGSPHKLPS